MPMRGALGYIFEMYMTATRISSVCSAEYSCGLVTGTPAPIAKAESETGMNEEAVRA